MTDFSELLDLQRRIFDEPAVTLARAASLLGVSERTVRRHLHQLEWHRLANGRVYITVRSLQRYLVNVLYYAPSSQFNLAKQKLTTLTPRPSK